MGMPTPPALWQWSAAPLIDELFDRRGDHRQPILTQPEPAAECLAHGHGTRNATPGHPPRMSQKSQFLGQSLFLRSEPQARFSSP